jgi:putative transposase
LTRGSCTDKGAKRSLLCEARGVPVGPAHDGANRHDQPLLAPTLESIPIERPKPTHKCPQGLCLDRGYDAPSMRTVAQKHGYTPHIRTRGEEIKLKARTPGWRARRWVVEACHSWINRNRALLIRWSKKEENHLALLMLACAVIALERARAATSIGGLSG